MGTGAQVREFPLGVEGNDGVLGQILDELHLVGLVFLLHIGDGLGAGLLTALQMQPLFADFLHLRLNLVQMLLGEGEGAVKIVVPALGNGGADGQLHLRPQALHGLGHDVRAGVPIGLAILGIFKGVQVFFGHGCVPPFRLGRAYKNPPLKESGVGYKAYSTVPPWLQRVSLPLIAAVTGGPVSAY